MKRKLLALGLLTILVAVPTTSCSNDDDFPVEVIQKSTLTINLTSGDIANYKKIDIEILETNTGILTKHTLENAATHVLELPYGSYKISANGIASTSNGDEVSVGANKELDIASVTTSISLDILIKQFNSDFIIEEVFFTGVRTPEGRNYNSSKYFKLTNNTDEILYADQLIIGQSEFLTTTNYNPTPYDVNNYFPVKGVMVLPGAGQDYPVNPGDFIVIADNAINHTQNTSTAYNLANANFEFPSNNPTLAQVDNPAVPNVEVIYTKMTYNMFFLHNRGFESYVIARFPAGESKETFLNNHKYNYEYTMSNGSSRSVSTYKIPNSWVIDAVNNSVETEFVHLLTSPSLDGGWTGCGTTNSDATRFGKSVRRKTLGKMANGKPLYKDTNNSTEDFIKNSEPSLKNGIIH